MKKFINQLVLGLLFSVFFFIGTCKTAYINYNGQKIESGDAAKMLYKEAELLRESKNLKAAFEKYNELVTLIPEIEETYKALYNMAEIKFDQREHKEAIKYLRQLMNSGADKSEKKECKIFLTRIYYLTQDYAGAVSLLNDLKENYSLEKKDEVFVTEVTARIYEERTQFSHAYKNYLSLYLLLSDEKKRQTIKTKLIDLINDKLSFNELETLIKKNDDEFPSDYVLIKLIKISNHIVNPKKCAEYTKLFEENFKNHPMSSLVKGIKEETENISQPEIKNIGLIIPMQGKFKVYGMQVLKAMMLALPVNEKYSGDDINVIVADSKDPNVDLEKTVEKLIVEGKVSVIIGPIVNQEALSAAIVAQKYGVPLIALSENENVVEVGDFIFRNNVSKELQAETLVGFAVNTLGIKNFAIFFPLTTYGEEFLYVFWDAVNRHKGQITAVERYVEDEKDFKSELSKLVGEYRKKIDFEAIFIPDNYLNASMIIPTLKYLDIQGVQIFGTSAWQNPNFLKRLTKESMEGIIFPSGFFNASEELSISDFVKKYSDEFKEEAGLLSAISYDTLNLVKAIIEEKKPKTREEIRNHLAGLNNFYGVLGKLGFNEKRNIDRSISLITISKENMNELKEY